MKFLVLALLVTGCTAHAEQPKVTPVFRLAVACSEITDLVWESVRDLEKPEGVTAGSYCDERHDDARCEVMSQLGCDGIDY